jgi:hypothetical protein
MKVVGVAGQLAQGKDVLCDELCRLLNQRIVDANLADKQEDLWTRGSFALAVKKVFMMGFSVDLEFIEQYKRMDEPPPGFKKNIRKSLQFVGDGFRQIKDNIWIEIALRENKNLIFSDCRYHNEAKAIREKKGVTILLYRPGFINDDPNPSESQLRPSVEWCADNLEEGLISPQLLNYSNFPAELCYYDYYFINDRSDLNSLYEKIKNQLVPFVEEAFKNV